MISLQIFFFRSHVLIELEKLSVASIMWIIITLLVFQIDRLSNPSKKKKKHANLSNFLSCMSWVAPHLAVVAFIYFVSTWERKAGWNLRKFHYRTNEISRSRVAYEFHFVEPIQQIVDVTELIDFPAFFLHDVVTLVTELRTLQRKKKTWQRRHRRKRWERACNLHSGENGKNNNFIFSFPLVNFFSSLHVIYLLSMNVVA